MIRLHIEHAVQDFDRWKAAFDSDPVGRQQAGVRQFWVSRPVDNPNYAIIDLEFDTRQQAEALLAAMQDAWRRVGGTLMQNPEWHLAEIVETKRLG